VIIYIINIFVYVLIVIMDLVVNVLI